MIFLFFIYGLIFFVLGLTIFHYPKRDSEFKLAKDLWLIAAFGVLHGVNEWIDMFMLIQGPGEIMPLRIIRCIMLSLSFACLIQFGAHIITGAKKGPPALKALPMVLFAGWGIATGVSSERLLMGDIWARYLLGIPGTFLTSYALVLEMREFKKDQLSAVVRHLGLAAAAFLAYGVLAGIIVPDADFASAAVLNYSHFKDTIGLPVQLFRTLCAIVITYSFIKVLGVFDWETKSRIRGLLEEARTSMEELKRLQDKLIQTEKLSALGRLTADVAHEIRNPLTAIGGFARRLKGKLQEGTKENEYAEMVVFEVARLERILKDVLNYLREPRYHLCQVTINEVLPAIVKGFYDLCATHAVQVKTEFSSDVPEMLIDVDQVRQAVNNLIANAIDAMPEGGTLTVRTGTAQRNSVAYVVISIIDTGTGIPEDKLYRLFDPFYTTKEVGHGTGLGLPLCKRIMEEHRGLIEVDSNKGKGSTFSLYFPYVPIEEQDRPNCWEYMKCGVEQLEGAVENRCAAYPHYGRICWAVSGTFCEGKVSGAIAQKLGDCKKCGFYNSVIIKKTSSSS